MFEFISNNWVWLLPLTIGIVLQIVLVSQIYGQLKRIDALIARHNCPGTSESEGDSR